MPNLLRCTAIGHLGRDPEIRYTTGGDAVAGFSMAVTERFGKTETTTWLNVSAFGKTAEIAQTYLKKGDPVYVDGRFRMREWADKDGAKRLSPEVTADRIVLLGQRQKEARRESSEASLDHQRTGGLDEMTEDIPF